MESSIAGRSLKLRAEDCAVYSEQMRELKRQQAVDYTMVLWQPALNLMGFSENTTLLEGDAVEDEQEFLNARLDNKPMVAIFRTQKLRLYAMFGEHSQGADLFIAHGYDWPEAAPGHPMFMEAVFCGGLSSFAMARTSKARKYRRQALKARSTVKDWIKKGNPNVRHYEALFDAEKAVLKGKYRAAEQYYQSAVSVAARGGFVHDAGLASERYGEFMLTVLKDEDGAVFHFDTSAKFYSDWGASKKVQQLQEKYSNLHTRPSHVSAFFGGAGSLSLTLDSGVGGSSWLNNKGSTGFSVIDE